MDSAAVNAVAGVVGSYVSMLSHLNGCRTFMSDNAEFVAKIGLGGLDMTSDDDRNFVNNVVLRYTAIVATTTHAVSSMRENLLNIINDAGTNARVLNVMSKCEQIAMSKDYASEGERLSALIDMLTSTISDLDKGLSKPDKIAKSELDRLFDDFKNGLET